MKACRTRKRSRRIPKRKRTKEQQVPVAGNRANTYGSWVSETSRLIRGTE